MNFPVELDDWIEDQKASGDENVGCDMYGLQPFPPAPSVGRNATPQLHSRQEGETLSNSQGSLEALDVLLLRYRQVLFVVADRVLGNHLEAEDAVRNCLLTVSTNAPKFEHEGAFRCWLVRVLIDEAVTILAKQARRGEAADGNCQYLLEAFPNQQIARTTGGLNVQGAPYGRQRHMFDLNRDSSQSSEALHRPDNLGQPILAKKKKMSALDTPKEKKSL